MAVADATSAAVPAAGARAAASPARSPGCDARRRGRRSTPSSATSGSASRPAVVLLLAAVPLFLLGGLAIRRATGADRAEHVDYPFQLALPSLAFYCAFFITPLVFLCLFAVATPVGFGGVEYGFDLNNFSAGLDRLYVDTFLRTLRTAAVGTC